MSLGEENRRYTKKVKSQRWVTALLQFVHDNNILVIEYPQTLSFPKSTFHAVVRGKYLEHTEDVSESLLTEGFKPFSLPWRPHGKCGGPDLVPSATLDKDIPTTSFIDGSQDNFDADNIDFGKKWTQANDLIDELERFVFAQRAMFYRAVGDTETDLRTKKLFSELRNNLKSFAQRTVIVPHRKVRSTAEKEQLLRSSQYFYTGLLTVDTPCTLNDLQGVAHSAHRIVPSASFDPPFELTQKPSRYLQCALISFQSLGQLCKCIQFESCNDRISLLLKSKKVTIRSPPPYFRVVGTTVTNGAPWQNDTTAPFVFLPGYGNANYSPEQNVHVLFRQTSHFDYRNNEYESQLQRRISTIAMSRKLANCSSSYQPPTVVDTDFYDDVFSLRWRKLPSLSKRWSETGCANDIHGSLQLCIPYIIVHGHTVVKEFLSLLPTDVVVHIVS